MLALFSFLIGLPLFRRLQRQTGALRRRGHGHFELVALAFADVPARRIRAMVGLKDSVNGPNPSVLEIARLSQVPGLVVDGKVSCRIWDNPQTEEAVILDTPTETKTMTVQNDSIKLDRVIPTWGASLLEIVSP